MIRRIVVIRAGALGDTILTFPAIRALRRRYPGARIEVVGYPDRWNVAGSLVDARISIEHPMFAGLLAGEASRELIAWLRGESEGADLQPADLAVAWATRDSRTVFASAGIERVVHASPFPPPDVHAAIWYLQSLGLPLTLDDEPLISLSVEERRVGQQVLREHGLDRPIMLHPGAGATWKRWPDERFGSLAGALRERGHDVAVVEGPADVGVVQAMLAHSGPLPIVRSGSPRQLAGILSQARLLVGNDSGVSHLAAAAGTSVIALFGPTDPVTWAPLGNVRVLRACAATSDARERIRVCEEPDCMAGVGVEDVLAAIAEAVA